MATVLDIGHCNTHDPNFPDDALLRFFRHRKLCIAMIDVHCLINCCVFGEYVYFNGSLFCWKRKINVLTQLTFLGRSMSCTTQGPMAGQLVPLVQSFIKQVDMFYVITSLLHKNS